MAQRSTGYILAGNHRYKAAVEAGAKSVPVIWVDVDDETAVRVLLADNRTNDVASYDNAVLAEILTELANGPGLEGTGYDGDDLDQIIGDLAGDEPKQVVEAPEAQIDRAEELLKVWGVERGQLWVAGNHRILCGDSTNEADVARLMNGSKVSAVVTDPPYGIGGTTSDKNNYVEYVDSQENLVALVGAIMPIWSRVADRLVITPGNGNQSVYPKPDWTMAWFTPAGVGRGPWGFCCWQPILCYGKDAKLSTGRGCHPDALVHTESAEKNGHPCAKPVKFWQWLMERTTNEDEDVADPFGGSGTTAVVAEILGKRSFCMEMSPGYVAITLQRLKDMGLDPVLADE